jgi:hypothetical protein
MEHKGVEFKVVQTASPSGWQWTFQVKGRRMRTGKAASRAIAIVFARAAIDKAIKIKRIPRNPKQ